MRTVINGQDVYLSADNIPEFNYSISELSDFTKIKGANSTTFDIPASNSARLALGGESMNEQALGDVPITVGEGGQVLFKGICTPIEWTEDNIKVVAYGDNSTWFDAAKNTKCVDVDLGYTQPVTASHVRQSWYAEFVPWVLPSRLQENNYFFPVIDYGSLSGYTPTTNVALNKIRFAVSVRALLSKFFLDNGFTLRIAGSLNSIWNSLMLPSSNHSYKVKPSTTIVSASTELALQQSGIGMPPFGPQYGIYALDTIDIVGPLFTLPTNDARFFAVSVDSEISVSIDGSFRLLRSNIFEANQFVELILQAYNVTDGIVIAEKQYSTLPYGYTGSQTWSVNEDVFTFSVESGKTYCIFATPRQDDIAFANNLFVQPGTTFTINAKPIETTTDLAGAEYFISSAVDPSINVSDLLTAVCNMFRLVINTDQASNEVTISHYDDYLLDITKGIDWRNRLNHSKAPAKIKPVVPKRYIFKYAEDSNDERAFNYNNQAIWTAEGIYDADGKADEKVQTLKFAATQQGYKFRTTIPVIKEKDKTTDYVKCKPRILVYGGPAGNYLDSTPPTLITLAGVAMPTFPRFYFAGQGGTDINLGFGDDNGRIGTLKRFWNSSLVRASKPYLRGDVMVYDDEVVSFDFNRPRLVNDGYDDVWMYVQNIKGKKFGDQDYSECELIPV